MKNNLLILPFAAIMANTLSAQITVDYTNLPSVGMVSVDAKDTLPNNINIGTAGANVVWNLTSIQNDSQDTTIFLNVNGTPCAADFTSSTMAFDQGDGLGYVSITPSALDIDGFCQQNDSIHLAIAFNPSWRLISFPSTYQTNFNGNTGYEIKMFYGQQNIDSTKVKHNAAYNSIIDGWGTVTTPAFSNVNCLRQKYTEFLFDSIFGKTFGQWILLESKADTAITYRWVTNSNNFILSEIKTNFAGDTTKEARYLYSMTNAIPENVHTEKSVVVYPNPSSEILFINGTGATSYLVIFDMNGKIVENTLLKKSNSTINVAAYDNGIYFYQIADLNGSIISKGKFAVAN